MTLQTAKEEAERNRKILNKLALASQLRMRAMKPTSDDGKDEVKMR